MKRQYPFPDFGSFHQRKMHIGVKEMDLGAESHLRMPLIYDKTINLLLKSTFNEYVKNIEVDDNNRLGLEIKKEGHQMVLQVGPNGMLRETLLPRKDESLHLKAAFTPTLCMSCSFSKEPIYVKCYHCDRKLCGSCCQRCSCCGEIFCSLCSIKTYQDKDDSASCFSCS